MASKPAKSALYPLYDYQRRWLNDTSPRKIGMWARQTGKTFTTTLEIVEDCLNAEARGKPTRWIILSAGERQAREAMEMGVQSHLQRFAIAFQALGYNWQDDSKALEVRLPQGSRITALPANPSTARGYSANVLLDEFAHHADSRKIWAALYPVISAGHLLRVVSTPNGKGNMFYRLWESASRTSNLGTLPPNPQDNFYVRGSAPNNPDRGFSPCTPGRPQEKPAGKGAFNKTNPLDHRTLAYGQTGGAGGLHPPAGIVKGETLDIMQADSAWSRHRTTIYEAVEQGLPRDIGALKQGMVDDDAWRQEFELEWLDEASAWLPWDLIAGVEDAKAGQPAGYMGGIVFIGWDIARRRDLSVLWAIEKVGDVLWTREVIALKGASFAEQQAELDRLLSTYRVQRVCIDQTGMGEAVVEAAQERHGRYRVEGVLFTSTAKQELAIGIKQAMEDRRLRLPMDQDIRQSHHSLRRVMSPSGNPRFDATNDSTGHGDYFWAHALAIRGANEPQRIYAVHRISNNSQGWRGQSSQWKNF